MRAVRFVVIEVLLRHFRVGQPLRWRYRRTSGSDNAIIGYVTDEQLVTERFKTRVRMMLWKVVYAHGHRAKLCANRARCLPVGSGLEASFESWLERCRSLFDNFIDNLSRIGITPFIVATWDGSFELPRWYRATVGKGVKETGGWP